jgi:hypothetical protein
MTKQVVHACDFREVPADTECMTAVWSFGGACRTCDHDECYRQGWRKPQVDADNRRRVAAKQRARMKK